MGGAPASNAVLKRTWLIAHHLVGLLAAQNRELKLPVIKAQILIWGQDLRVRIVGCAKH